jgi:hypothetical protein
MRAMLPSRLWRKIKMANESSTADLEAANRKKAYEAVNNRNNSRVDRLSEIADNNEAMRKEDMVELDDGNLQIDSSPEDAAEQAASQESMEAERALAELQAKQAQEEGVEPTTEEEPSKQEAQEDKPADVKVVNGETHYLTVVNGKEKWLTLPQLRATAQKVESADEYLAAAAESVRNAARLDLSSKKKEDEPSKVEKVDMEKVLRSVAMGDEEAIKKFASAFEALQESRAKPSEVTPDVLQQIDERWAFRSAADWFNEQYKDLLDDPYLKQLVVERDAAMAKSSPNMPYKQRLKSAGDEIRGWLNKQKGASGPKVSASETKVDRKKTLANVPGASQRQASTVDEEPEETPSEVIAKMAKARGQERAIVHRPTSRA